MDGKTFRHVLWAATAIMIACLWLMFQFTLYKYDTDGGLARINRVTGRTEIVRHESGRYRWQPVAPAGPAVLIERPPKKPVDKMTDEELAREFYFLCMKTIKEKR